MLRIPLFRVLMSPAAEQAAVETLRSGYVGQGPKVEAFETALQQELGLPRRPVTVNSATTGLDLAYRLAGVNRFSYVITTPVTCLATNIPIAHLGARILWADVDARGLIDPQSVAAIVRDCSFGIHQFDKAAAVVAVDWGGTPCDYAALRKAASGIPIIQDAAHSYGADFSESGMGDYVVWSFQAIKGLTCCDGGAVLTPDAQQDRARMLRWYGLDRSKSASMRCTQQIAELGWKWHLNDLAASIGLANMPAAREGVEKSRENARQILKGLEPSRKLALPRFDPRSSYWLLTVLAPAGQQQRFIEYLDTRGIEASIVHARNDAQRLLPAAVTTATTGVDNFCSREVCIPCGWWLSDGDIDRIINACLDYDYV